MYGAILGDIIGSPYEFDRGAKIKSFPLFVKKSRFTDDTVMTVAVADALLYAGKEGGEDKVTSAVVSSMQHWGRKYPKVGYGGNFREWLKEKNPMPYSSFGNGSAMRVSPVGWLYGSIERTREVARWTAEVTHNHPEGIKGAESIASAIYLARMGESKETIKNYIEDEFGYNLSRTLQKIRPVYHMDVTCQGSVPEAIIAFLEATDFEDTVRNAVSIGGDTDTTACIAGSIAEAYYGLMPNLEEECLKRIPEEMKTVLHRFDRVRGKAIQGEPIIEAAILRYHKNSSQENEMAVLNSIYMCMKEDDCFLLPSSEVRVFDECVANGDYDGSISIEAYTSDREFFMGLDEEDGNDTTEIKIFDLLSFIAKATDEDAGVDINYAKKFYLDRDMAKRILAREKEGLFKPIEPSPKYHPVKVQLAVNDITEELIDGVKYCFICSHDYANYCELYHGNGEIYSVNLDDDGCCKKLRKNFPAFREFRNSKSSRMGAWIWGYIGGSCVLMIHEDVLSAYQEKTGTTEFWDWSPDDAYKTICELMGRKNK